MRVIIKDETTGRDIPLNLSVEQYRRAQQDSEYVQELLRSYYVNSSNSSVPAVVLDPTESSQKSQKGLNTKTGPKEDQTKRQRVIIQDESTGRDILLNLSLEQYEKAQQDPGYVQELIKTYDENSSDSILAAVVLDPTVSQTNTTCQENHVPTPLEQIVSQTNTMCQENDVPTPLERIVSQTNTTYEENVVPTSLECINNDENSGSLFIWSDSCILLLLTLYEQKKEEFGMNRHKKIFNEIAMKMKQTNPDYTMTGSQCQSKINSLKKTYKKILDHNNTSGNDRVTWPYFGRMNEIFGQTGWAHPVATASEAGPSETAPTSEQEKPPKRKINVVFDEYFKTKKMIMTERLEMRKESLKLKKEQHKEKMELLKSICKLLDTK